MQPIHMVKVLVDMRIGVQMLFDLQKRAAAPGREESPPASPSSNYSSAWETSESDADGGLDLDELQETRPSPTTIFEDNQAKMTEKGGKGEAKNIQLAFTAGCST